MCGQDRKDPKLWKASRQIVGSAGGMYTGNWVGIQRIGFFRLSVAVRKAVVKNIQILKKALCFP